LPFEPPYFTKVGLATSYVGHPVVETGADKGDGAGFRRRHGIAPDAKAIAVLPGSRRGEVRTLLPIFGEALACLAARYPGSVSYTHLELGRGIDRGPIGESGLGRGFRIEGLRRQRISAIGLRRHQQHDILGRLRYERGMDQACACLLYTSRCV